MTDQEIRDLVLGDLVKRAVEAVDLTGAIRGAVDLMPVAQVVLPWVVLWGHVNSLPISS